MKLLAIEMSRLTALFNVTRPQGQAYLPHVASGLVERYSFAGVPQSFAELQADRVEFKQGLFDGSAIESLEVYSDGIVVTSRSNTELIDAFVADLQEWMQDEIGLSTVKNRTIDRMYESQLIVEATDKVLKPLSALSAIAGDVSKMVAANTGLEVEYHSAGFMLSSDQTQLASLKPSVFRLERRLASEFSLNQFVSFAPLKTRQHMDVLEKLEELF